MRAPIKAGDEFCAHVKTTLVRFRAITDEARALDGEHNLFVWAEPLRPLSGKHLNAKMVIFTAHAEPKERVP